MYTPLSVERKRIGVVAIQRRTAEFQSCSPRYLRLPSHNHIHFNGIFLTR